MPVTPEQIAAAAVEAAKAGAAVVHCHVRDPETGKPSRDAALYREVVERIRESGTDIIVNLTAGMGGDLEIGAGEHADGFGPGTDLVGAADAPGPRRRAAAGNLHAGLRHPEFRRRRSPSTSPPRHSCARAPSASRSWA